MTDEDKEWWDDNFLETIDWSAVEITLEVLDQDMVATEIPYPIQIRWRPVDGEPFMIG